MSSFSFLSGEVDDVLSDTVTINKLLTQYRKSNLGTGLYGQLREMDQNMSYRKNGLSAEALSSVEGKAFIKALNALKALHKSEANIKSQMSIDKGISTKAKEEAKKEKYEEQRFHMDIEPLNEAGGFGLIPILLVGGVLAGGFLLLKG